MIALLKQIYQYDQQAKEQQLDDQQRLKYHQQHSAPVMNKFKTWIEQQQEAKNVEPIGTSAVAWTGFVSVESPIYLPRAMRVTAMMPSFSWAMAGGP